jgi:hypothetical protein
MQTMITHYKVLVMYIDYKMIMFTRGDTTLIKMSYPYGSRTREDKIMRRLVTITNMRLNVA